MTSANGVQPQEVPAIDLRTRVREAELRNDGISMSVKWLPIGCFEVCLWIGYNDDGKAQFWLAEGHGEMSEEALDNALRRAAKKLRTYLDSVTSTITE